MKLNRTIINVAAVALVLGVITSNAIAALDGCKEVGSGTWPHDCDTSVTSCSSGQYRTNGKWVWIGFEWPFLSYSTWTYYTWKSGTCATLVTTDTLGAIVTQCYCAY